MVLDGACVVVFSCAGCDRSSFVSPEERRVAVGAGGGDEAVWHGTTSTKLSSLCLSCSPTTARLSLPTATALPLSPLDAPLNWPTALAYLTAPASSALLPRALKLKFCAPTLPPSAPPRLRIQLITTKGHPAFGQSGLFNSSKTIPRGTWIRDYLGVVHTEAEADAKSDYDLCLQREDGDVIGIDATERGNEARFVNDYRGVLERPNAVFELRTWELGGGRGQGVRMAIFAGPKGVDKGSEICVSYGRGFWDSRRKEEEAAKEERDESV